MSIRAIATLVIALVLGLVAVLIINSAINKPPPPPPVAAGPVIPGTPVVVAAQPIGRGVAIQPALLKVVNYPAGSAPAGAFASVAAVADGKMAPRVALRDLNPDEPVLSTRVSDPGGKLNLSDILDPGMQAVSLRTDDISDVAGFVMPGDHIDLLMTRTLGANTVTQILLENLKVIAIDQIPDTEFSKPYVAHVVTFEATPKQAQIITLARSVGNLSFSLRHIQDTSKLLQLATSTASAAFAPPGAPPAPAAGRSRSKAGPPPEPFGVVRVTRATETTVYQLGGQ